MTKFVFVTGGVVSSLGKGIASASLAAILESRGLKVTLIKLDPYINVDPGTMSPFQHGEVFVTDDGAETDLDLGHYERFITTRMKRTQQLHHRPDLQERAREGAPRRLPRQDGAGDPARHQRDPGVHPARRRRRHADEMDVAIVEIGGTVGDIESLPFLEAVRQMSLKMGPTNAAFVHLTLRAVDRRRRRAEDQADPAQRAEAARDRHHARRPAVPRRPADPRRRARQDLALRQRARVRRDLDVGRRHDLQGAAHAARAGARRADLRQAAPAHQAGQPDALGQAGRRGRAPAARGDDRDVRQVRRAVGLVQVAQRGAAPRRHPQPRAGEDRVRRLRRPDAGQRRATWRASTPSWCPAASASAASRARSSPRSSRASTRSPTSASASGMQVATIEYARHKAGLAGANSTEFDPRRRTR